MVSRDSPNSVGKALSEKVPAQDSPLEETPHKASNGELTITCRNRHCPKCQAQARERWLAARERELLDTSYFHVVFTVPHELNGLASENPRLFYDLLFTASVQTLLEIASDPKHLGAEIGVIAILHTWGQNLLLALSHAIRICLCRSSQNRGISLFFSSSFRVGASGVASRWLVHPMVKTVRKQPNGRVLSPTDRTPRPRSTWAVSGF